jgi:hypothetical protein
MSVTRRRHPVVACRRDAHPRVLVPASSSRGAGGVGGCRLHHRQPTKRAPAAGTG